MGDQTVSSRVQIPLRLAWSISVHKSQGMTIPNLTVNLAGVFEYGQAYVALSRATELKLLTLRGFSEKCFRAHPKVKVSRTRVASFDIIFCLQLASHLFVNRHWNARPFTAYWMATLHPLDQSTKRKMPEPNILTIALAISTPSKAVRLRATRTALAQGTPILNRSNLLRPTGRTHTANPNA